MKVCFETFGCRLNRAEALEEEAKYLARGWERTESHKDADLFIVRGCSVTRRAQSTCEKLIEHLKRKYPHTPVRICGCLKDGEIHPPSEASYKAGAMRGLSRLLQRKEPHLHGSGQETASPSPLPTRTARAYLKVQDGCSGKCSFCIVTKFRGTSVSEPFTTLVDKAKRFIDAGYHEIVVTGCNLSLYASEGKRLPDLVAALAELTPPLRTPQPHNAVDPSSCRIRIGSLEPGASARETVDVMTEHDNVCRFLHIPVQSGSNRILTAMRRPYLIDDVSKLADHALKSMPLIGLGADMITGFPGETDIDFTATKGLLKRIPFSNVHVFPYSERPGTLAAALPDAIPRETRHQRAHVLADLAKEQRAQFAKKFIGHPIELVIEDEAKLSGWTGEYFACEITNKNRAKLQRKQLVSAHVLDVHGDRLKAILV